MPPENVKTRLKESNVPPLNNDFESNVPQLFILDSRTFVAKSAFSRLRAFWGALLAKIWWEGAQKHFKGLGEGHRSLSSLILLIPSLYSCFPSLVKPTLLSMCLLIGNLPFNNFVLQQKLCPWTGGPLKPVEPDFVESQLSAIILLLL